MSATRHIFASSQLGQVTLQGELDELLAEREQREFGLRGHLRVGGRGIVVQMPLHFSATFLRITARIKNIALAWHLRF